MEDDPIYHLIYVALFHVAVTLYTQMCINRLLYGVHCTLCTLHHKIDGGHKSQETWKLSWYFEHWTCVLCFMYVCVKNMFHYKNYGCPRSAFIFVSWRKCFYVHRLKVNTFSFIYSNLDPGSCTLILFLNCTLLYQPNVITMWHVPIWMYN